MFDIPKFNKRVELRNELFLMVFLLTYLCIPILSHQSINFFVQKIKDLRTNFNRPKWKFTSRFYDIVGQ